MFEERVDSIIGDYKGKAPSYRVILTIFPDWTKIMNHIIPKELQEKKKIEELLSVFSSTNDNYSSWRNFRFVFFKDKESGLEQIWSDHHKTFVKGFEIRCQVIEGLTPNPFDEHYDAKHSDFINKNRKQLEDNGLPYNILNPFVITPEFLGFDNYILPDDDLMENCKFSKIPFFYVMYFLLAQDEEPFSFESMNAVKKFPDKIQKILEENNIKYDTSYDFRIYGLDREFNKEKTILLADGAELYSENISRHVLISEFYSLSFEIETFYKY